MGGDGNDDDILGAWIGFQSPCRFPAIHTRHGQIHQDNGGMHPTSDFNRFFAVLSGRHMKLTKGEIFHQHFAAINGVIDHEDTWFERH